MSFVLGVMEELKGTGTDLSFIPTASSYSCFPWGALATPAFADPLEVVVIAVSV